MFDSVTSKAEDRQLFSLLQPFNMCHGSIRANVKTERKFHSNKKMVP